jgi:hypothetical protein
VRNPKVFIITVAIGFFFSFIIALFSRAGFGIALIRAFVSALVCGAVAVGGSYVLRKFLLEGAPFADVSVSDDDSEAPPGGRVNIVLDDEALPAEPDDPRFDVRNIEKSIAAQPPDRAVDGPNAGNSGFDGSDILDDIGEASARQTESAAQAAANTEGRIVAERIAEMSGEERQKKAPESGASIGTGAPANLPDIDGFMAEDLSTDRSVVEDSDFASASKQEGAPGRKVRPENFDATDSKAIASAIRTLLVDGK